MLVLLRLLPNDGWYLLSVNNAGRVLMKYTRRKRLRDAFDAPVSC